MLLKKICVKKYFLKKKKFPKKFCRNFFSEINCCNFFLFEKKIVWKQIFSKKKTILEKSLKNFKFFSKKKIVEKKIVEKNFLCWKKIGLVTSIIQTHSKVRLWDSLCLTSVKEMLCGGRCETV